MKDYVQVTRSVDRRSQFTAACRYALRKTGNPIMENWVDDINGAVETMDSIIAGKQEPYSMSNETEHFREAIIYNDDYYQIYCKFADGSFYNFIFQYWEDHTGRGHGYFYCTEGKKDD